MVATDDWKLAAARSVSWCGGADDGASGGPRDFPGGAQGLPGGGAQGASWGNSMRPTSRGSAGSGGMPELKVAKADLSSLPEWSECFDPREGKSYFINNMTGETQYDPPPGYVAHRGKRMYGPEMRAAMLVQKCFRRKAARKRVRQKRAELAAQRGLTTHAPVWSECMDPQWGTRTTTTAKPASRSGRSRPTSSRSRARARPRRTRPT